MDVSVILLETHLRLINNNLRSYTEHHYSEASFVSSSVSPLPPFHQCHITLPHIHVSTVPRIPMMVRMTTFMFLEIPSSSKVKDG